MIIDIKGMEDIASIATSSVLWFLLIHMAIYVA